MQRLSQTQRARFGAFLALVLIIPLGIYTKSYHGIGSQWVHHYLGAILYEMAWCYLGFLLYPTPKSVWRVPIIVFLLTSGLEFLQLWQNPTLNSIRVTFLGKMLLGSTFSGWDFFYYALGCLLGAGNLFLFLGKRE